MQYQEDYQDYDYEPEPAWRSNRTLWIIGIAVLVALVACACCICLAAGVLAYLYSDAATSPEPPLPAPPASSVQEIVNIQWQWSELTETQPAGQSVVPNPQNYVVVFRPDGQLQVKADCNVASGVYAVSGSNMTLNLGPMTMAMCPPESLSEQFVALLANVASYELEGGRLVLNLRNDTGRIVFNNGGPAESGLVAPPTPTPSPGVPPQPVIVAPTEAKVGQEVTFDGSQSQPGSYPIVAYQWDFGDGNTAEGAVVAQAYGQPGTYKVTLTVRDESGASNATTAQIAISEEAPPPQPTLDPAGGLVGPNWKWTELIEDGPSAVPNPEVYTLTFYEDRSLDFVADCNSGSGTYLVDGNQLKLDLGIVSLIACGPDSLSDQYMAILAKVVSFERDGDRLGLYLDQGAGQAIFLP